MHTPRADPACCLPSLVPHLVILSSQCLPRLSWGMLLLASPSPSGPPAPVPASSHTPRKDSPHFLFPVSPSTRESLLCSAPLHPGSTLLALCPLPLSNRRFDPHPHPHPLPLPPLERRCSFPISFEMVLLWPLTPLPVSLISDPSALYCCSPPWTCSSLQNTCKSPEVALTLDLGEEEVKIAACDPFSPNRE